MKASTIKQVLVVSQNVMEKLCFDVLNVEAAFNK